MDKFVTLALIVLVGLILTQNINAEKTEMDSNLYHYAFVLSCGETILYSSPVELSSSDLLTYEIKFEKEYCGVDV